MKKLLNNIYCACERYAGHVSSVRYFYVDAETPSSLGQSNLWNLRMFSQNK